MMSLHYGFLAFVAIALIAGVSDAHPPKKIVSGVPTTTAEFPYMASLRKNGIGICGAAIIDQRHVITAAHCVKFASSPLDNADVMTGSEYIDGGTIYSIESVTSHPQYNSSRIGSPNDIAIIRLGKEISFTSGEMMIALPSRPPPTGVSATVAGWGIDDTHMQTLAYTLKKMNSTILSHEQCSARARHPEKILTNYHLCALPPPGQGFCKGDSGGPLVYDNQLIGIVAWTTRRCAVGYPDVYTNVSYFVPWIEENITNGTPPGVIPLVELLP